MSQRITRDATVASVILVAIVAAIVSYAHMHDLALEHGESWRSVLIPLAVDGMIASATAAIVSQRRRNQSAGWVPWLGLSLGILASLAANVAAARPELIAHLIAAWPPVALAVSIETLVVVLRAQQVTADADSTEEAEELNPAPETQPEFNSPVTQPDEKPRAKSGAERMRDLRARRLAEKQAAEAQTA
jgi:hypothetical protein